MTANTIYSDKTNPPEDFYLWHLVELGLLAVVIDGMETRAEGATSPVGAPAAAHEADQDGKRIAYVPTPLWERAAKAAEERKKNGRTPVTVALIDTGVDTGHPNLERNCIEQVDFGPDVNGVTYSPPTAALDALRRCHEAGEYGADWAELARRALDEVFDLYGRQGVDAQGAIFASFELQKIGPTGAPPDKGLVEKLLGLPKAPVTQARPNDGQINEIRDMLAGLDLTDIPDRYQMAVVMTERDRLVADMRPATELKLPDPSRYFGSHGTACAGLVAGHPPADVDPVTPGPIPYFGVNPFCKIRSYATPYSHELLPVIRALIAAYVSKAEVIYIPRGLPDPAARAEMVEISGNGTRIDRPLVTAPDEVFVQDKDQALLSRLMAQKAIFEALLKMISSKRLVILAAGNDGLANDLSYPARLINEDGFGNLVVVGARNRSGRFAAYTNGDGDGLKDKIFWMLSDDGEALDQRHYSIDRRGFYGTDFDYDTIAPGRDNTFNPWSLLSLDVRGSYGRAATPGPEEPVGGKGTELSEIYTLFSGTSAASALVAGLASLAILLDKVRADKPDPASLRDYIRQHHYTHVGGTS
ncbi:S8 family serine peptidase [Rhodovulum euryhalinum]|uniref:Subtilase family protein n=1 Tax=Rhodovulum euryhalinum TaxID=35805 RepID=A0A4R2KIA9_9RHOB|nr:S8/S53 family peptidase [Rhodovulum euryhalinum]TCO70279.1 subtilase family protein [Rhodovulum euryhalinum]